MQCGNAVFKTKPRVINTSMQRPLIIYTYTHTLYKCMLKCQAFPSQVLKKQCLYSGKHLATIYKPALLLYNCLTNLLALHCEVISATALALTNAVQLPKPQLHITAVLLLTVFDVVLCQTNATKLRHLLCDPYSIYNGVRVTTHLSPSQLFFLDLSWLTNCRSPPCI